MEPTRRTYQSTERRQSETVEAVAVWVSEQLTQRVLSMADQHEHADQALAELPIIGGEAGAVLTLDDLATINEAHEREEERVDFNGQRAIILKILPGVLSSFLTTVSVFIPLAFLAGESGTVSN